MIRVQTKMASTLLEQQMLVSQITLSLFFVSSINEKENQTVVHIVVEDWLMLSSLSFVKNRIVRLKPQLA